MSKNKAVAAATAVTVNKFDDKLKGERKNIGGSKSDHWNDLLVRQAVDALWLKNSDPETRDKQLSATIAALIGIGPKDELEGMMAAQLLASHNAAMECYRRAMIGEQTFLGRQENLAQANKLSRTYAVLLEALNRHRGKGQQKVTVEHVHVYEGGQAVVGVVGTPGGRGRSKMEVQPRDKQLSHAPEPAMWCQNASRDALPIGSHEERQMPASRRKVAGRAHGQ